MRLLFITQDFPPGIGGIQTYSAEHAARISQLCDDFLLVCPDDSESEAEDVNHPFDISRIRIPANLLFIPLFRMLPRLLKTRPFDATFHSQWQTVWPAVKARERGLVSRVFVAAHARELLFNPYEGIPILGREYRRKREYLLNSVDHFFPVSNYTAGLLMAQGVPRDKITVIINGTDPQLFKPMDSSRLKKELGLENSVTLMTVTRLVKRKGIDTVLHAISSLRDEFENIRYIILGTGPEEKKLKDLVKRLGMDSCVHFLGKVNYRDLPRYYNVSDLFVLSSRTELPDVEGFGIVFLEANACEKPVIGTDSGGVSSAIEHNRTGLIVREKNPVELAGAIRAIMKDASRGRQMGKRGRQRVLDEANWDILSRELLAQLEIQLGEAGVSAGVPEKPGGGIREKGEKKVLMVAPYFLPRRRVGALRPFKFAAHLKEYGWEPHVLTIKSDGTFTDLEREMARGINIEEMDPKMDLTVNSGSQLKMKDLKPAQKRPAGEFLSRLGKRLADAIDRRFPLDTWLLLFFKEFLNIRKYALQLDADVIWSTGDPWSGHWMANRIAKQLDLPWIADFRDPWTLGGVQLRSRSAFSEAMDRRFEKTVMNRADFLTFTSERTEELYVSHYPEIKGRTATITNSFDRALSGAPDASGRFAFDMHYLNLVFFGKFRGLSPAAPVAELLGFIEMEEPDVRKRIRVYSFGDLEKSDAELAGKLGVLDSFIIEDPVPPEEGPNLLAAADILLLSTDPRRLNIIPAKLWDYIAVGGPVLSIAPNAEIGRILKKTGTGVHMPLSEKQKIADLLADCVRAKRNGDDLPLAFAVNQEEVDRYDARQTTRHLADILNQFATAGS
ncbi:MAG: glycosyltransferase [Balneolaceae bacterium]